MEDPFRQLLSDSALAIEASAAVLGRVEVVTRAVDRQVDHSRTLIREARHLLQRRRNELAGGADRCRMWRLQGQSVHAVECTIDQIGPSTFRVAVARNGLDVIVEQFADAHFAVARARQLGDDLLDLGWDISTEPASEELVNDLLT